MDDEKGEGRVTRDPGAERLTVRFCEMLRPYTKPGEDVFDTFERLAVFGCMDVHPTQRSAARLLGVSERVMCHKLDKHDARRIKVDAA